MASLFAKVCFVFVLFVIGFVSAQDYCVTNPTSSNCSSYYPNENDITASNTQMCSGMMGSMAGCTINSLCSKEQYNSQYCATFSIYMDICDEMPMMPNCSTYRTMCVQGSYVPVCKYATLPLPNGQVLQQNISLICEMPMAPCSDCTTTSCASPLITYSQLCMMMPEMEQCAGWHTLCELIPDWSLCSSKHSSTKIPPMRMYFHFSFMDYVLFQNWVPDTSGSYAWTWIVVFVFTVFFEFLKLYRTRCEKKWNAQEYTSLNGGGFLDGEAPFRARIDITRGFLHALEVAWGFLVMLVVMTYNVGLFFAVLAGSFVGMVVVGRFVPYVPKAGCH